MPRAIGWPALPLVLAAGLVLASYWPGIMTWDAAREYGQALHGPIDDWHPPAMIWLWRQLTRVAPGPAPMLLVQLALTISGYALLAQAAWRRGRPALAWGIAGAALFPVALAIEGAVLKDCLMAGAILCAAGLIAAERPGRWRRAGAAVLLLAAATLRVNAFLACLPWLVMAVPPRWRAGRRRLAGATCLALVALVAAMPLANRLVGAVPSGVALSQITFDLGGITYFSGEDAFPPLPIADTMAVNRGCYRPALWDSYSWWVDDQCPIGFVRVRAALAGRPGGAPGWWLGAVLHHPLAYARHRLAHANQNLRFLVAAAPPQLVPDGPQPNPWGFAPPPRRLRTAIDALAGAIARTPLGWPVWWLAVAAGVLLAARGQLARLMAASALLYGGGYLVLSVASDLRYHLWTMIAALLAAVLAGEELAKGPRPGPRRMLLALAPLLLVTLAGAIARRWIPT